MTNAPMDQLTAEQEAEVSARLDRLDQLLEEILVVLEKLKADGKVSR